MNKMQGFYMLREAGLPAVPWKPFTSDTVLEPVLLWTVRSAVQKGKDLNLPRLIGVAADQAEDFGRKLLKELPTGSLVLYYPYFIAEKSGVMEVTSQRVVLEAVEKDLWNLVTDGHRNVTVVLEREGIRFIGDDRFLEQEEMLQLIDHAKAVRLHFQGEMLVGQSVFLEWSFARPSSLDKKPAGEKKLVFYEIRTVD